MWSAANGNANNMTFRNADLTENDEVVTFTLPAKIDEVRDLLIYDTGESMEGEWVVDYATDWLTSQSVDWLNPALEQIAYWLFDWSISMLY